MDPSASGPDQSDNAAEPQRRATGKWPAISDYWPDRPRRRRPNADHSLLQPTSLLQPATQGGTHWVGGSRSPARPGRGGPRLVLRVVLAASLLVVAGAVVATMIKQAHRQPVDAIAVPSAATPGQGAQAGPTPTPELPAATSAASLVPLPASRPVPASVPAPVTGTAPPPSPAATFELVSASPAVTVHTRDLGADRYRVSVAKGSGVVPKISSSGAVYRLTLTGGEAPVDITLSANVRWTVRLSGGISQSVLDFADSSPEAIDLAGAASRIVVTLPRPSGTLAVRLTRGVSELRVHIPPNVAIRLTLRVGASQVVLDGLTHNDVAPGAVLTTPGWAAARNRVDLDAVAGMSLLAVDEG